MGTRHADRLWAAGGVISAAALLAIAWFFLISPQNGEASSLRDRTDAASLRLPSLQKRLTELRKQNGDLKTYEAQLERDRKALPTESDLATFLSDLQAAGDSVGVSVGGVSVGAPTQVTAAGARLSALPVTLSADGDTADVNRFLDQLQQVQPRAVLITSASVSANPQRPGASTVNLSLQVFVAPPPVAAATASPTTKTS
jgi:type IV pilus assembly protein PilO